MKNKQTGLQRLLKILGIIALTAVIVFSTAACDGGLGGGGGGNNSGNSADNGNGGGEGNGGNGDNGGGGGSGGSGDGGGGGGGGGSGGGGGGSGGESAALTTMKKYITDVVTHFKGKIYSWDVLNEVFPDGVSASADWKNVMRQENPWYKAIGSDFVYEGFLAARQADPVAILYYNDYNMDNAGKATMVRNMVRDVNAKYKQVYPNETRLLIEGIGMQSHHNTNVTAAQIKASLDLFKPLGVKISISELDVLGQSYQQFAQVGQGPNKHGNTTVNAEGLQKQASLYGEYMTVFLQYDDIIERVSLWGVTDDKSWRSAGLPLLFDPNGKAKASYHSFVGAPNNNSGIGTQTDIMSLSPMKDQFSSNFMIGNIFNPGDVGSSSVTNQQLTHHFNVLTAENNMKPSYIAPSKGSYNFTTADNMVNAAKASGFKVVGHTLLWHSQNASWMNSL
jgi:GH35 family endo-1,4-beta-xylanase